MCGFRIAIRQLSLLRCSAALKHTLTGDDYQFLQKSEIPSYHFQKSLRRLPIPKLERTCERFLAAAEAVLHEIRFMGLKSVVNDFCKREGPQLHKELVAYDRRNKHTSYISEPWFDMYLSDRLPCPVNYNPFMMYSPDPNTPYNDQLTRATNFVISYGRMKRSLDACLLEPEVFHMNPKKSDTKFFRTVCRTLPPSLSWFGAIAFKAFPLDMSQYSSLFGGSRIPQKGKDRLFHCADPKHFIVLRGGKIYSVDLFDNNGMLLSPEQVHACLAMILSDAATEPKGDQCVGSLTSLDRGRWAEVREELSSLGENAASLHTIDSALFALCLDSLDTEDPQRLIRSLLYGDDASNRWFDKCFQLIVDRRGQATINFEHSWGDGVAVLRLMEESFRDTNSNHFVHPRQTVDTTVNVGKHCRPVKFTLTGSLKSVITEAQHNHAMSTSGLQFGMVEYFGLSRDSIKKSKLSPDSVMQLAIQLAFYKLYRDFVPTYESCSTAAFLKGRTECMRSATKATHDAVLAIEKSSTAVPKQLLIECSRVHSQLVKEASMGQGFDRHLMGLRVTAERLGHKPPALFTDPDYKYMNEFVISTSTLTTDTICLGGFGPVVRNGFGIGYVVSSSKLGAVISSYKDKRDAEAFASSLLESLDIIKAIVMKN